MAEEAGLFGFADVARTISDKMVRRHPHVFSDAAMRDAAMQTAAWEAQKSAERAVRAETGALAGVPAGLPALVLAAKLTARAARVGFDWPNAEAVLDKLDEEIGELRAELPAGDPARLADEVGDLLFVVANLARKLDLDPEACLRQANRKFSGRFNKMEQYAELAGKILAEMSLDDMEAHWQQVKQSER
jgi:ATP diphosphatase